MSADAWILILHETGETGLTIKDVEVHAAETTSGVLVRERIFQLLPRPGFPGVNDRTLINISLSFIPNCDIEDIQAIYQGEGS